MRIGTMDVTVEVFPGGVVEDRKAERYHIIRNGQRVRVNVNGRLGKAEMAEAVLDAVAFLAGEEIALANIKPFAAVKVYVPLVPA